jgi:hypothetical protein
MLFPVPGSQPDVGQSDGRAASSRWPDKLLSHYVSSLQKLLATWKWASCWSKDFIQNIQAIPSHTAPRKWILVVTGFIKSEVIMYHEIMHEATKCAQRLQMPIQCHLTGCPESSSHVKNVQEVEVTSNHISSSRSTAGGAVWSTDWWKPGWQQDQGSQGWAGIGRSCHQGNKNCVTTDGFRAPGKINHCSFYKITFFCRILHSIFIHCSYEVKQHIEELHNCIL